MQMLLDVHLELGPPAEAVRCFEIVKEKWPAEEIPFAKIVKVGAAYHEMGEYERSYLIFRATIESSFMRETGVAGFLDQHAFGDFQFQAFRLQAGAIEHRTDRIDQTGMAELRRRQVDGDA